MATDWRRLLEQSAARTPEGPAVDDGKIRMTYAELHELATTLAHALTAVGVSEGDRVVYCGERSCSGVAVLHAIASIGAAYVPLHMKDPAARNSLLVDDCSAAAIILDETAELGFDLSNYTRRRFDVPDQGPLTLATRSVPITDQVKVDLAYILYTSGSTGYPKGVAHSPVSAMAFVEWAVGAWSLDDSDVVASFTSWTFDLSVFDIFVACRAAALLRLAPSLDIFPILSAKLIADSGATVVYQVPSFFARLSARASAELARASAVRLILCAGEVLASSLVENLQIALPQATFANLYGPTETNVCLAYVVDPKVSRGSTIPIGFEIGCDTVVLLRPDGTPAIDGEPGEMCVAGDTLMDGYWRHDGAMQRPEVRVPGFDQRFYPTGDFGVRDPTSAVIDFVGREDDIVKVRGYRVGLKEVEAAFLEIPEVIECVVGLDASKNRLSAWFTALKQLDLGYVRRDVSGRLPRYMVPSQLEQVEEMARLSNGKLDRRLPGSRMSG